MIVTCPSCEAKYRVSPEALSARSGKVKCAACGHNWVVEDEALTLMEAVEPEPVVEPDPEPAPEPEPSIREKPAAAVRARAQKQKQKQRLAVEGAGWAAIAACMMVVCVSAAVFRVNIVQAFPHAAGAYAAVGMAVNPYGLEVDELTASFAEGQLLIEGVVHNIRNQDTPMALLNARVLDSQGVVLTQWPVALEAQMLPAHGAERFQTTLDSVPEGASRVEVIVADSGASVLEPNQADAGSEHMQTASANTETEHDY